MTHLLEWPETGTTPNVCKNMEPQKLLCIAGKMQNDTVTLETVWWFLIKLNIFGPYNSVIMLLGIVPKKL